MKQATFAWLKDRRIFTSGGHKTLRSYLNSQREITELHKNDKRFGRRQKLNRKRNTR
jgi:hypothetical protein